MVKSSSSTTSSSVQPTTTRRADHHHHSLPPPSTSTMAVPSSSTPAVATTAAPQIRHAGRVHIRGRIRRVWRPRRLELLSDGHLLFYDDSNTSPAHGLLKYTLRVTSARILDVMTIRDLHTGLPRGTYGFLIRGQRIATDGTDAAALLDSPTFDVLPIVEDYHGAAVGGPSSHHHFPPLKESFVLAEAPTPQPVRDYLCAVESLEQAQMWVVALQWAAHYMKLHLDTSEDEHWWKIDYSPSRHHQHHHQQSLLLPHHPPPHHQHQPVVQQARHQHQQQQPPSVLQSATTAGTIGNVKKAETKVRPPAVSPPLPPPPPTKTLVTKATGYTIKRQQQPQPPKSTTGSTSSQRYYWPWWSSSCGYYYWSFAYEIHVLCLSVVVVDDHMTQSSETTTITTTPVEEWTVYKTATELADICADAPRLLQNLPRAISWREILWSPTALFRRLDQAVSVVDSVLRSFALAPDTVGSLAAALSRTGNGQVVVRQHRTIATVEIDRFVRTWLQQQSQQQQQQRPRFFTTIQGHLSQTLQQLQQHPHYRWVGVGGAAAVAMGIPLVVQYYYCSNLIFVVPVRVDCLVLSWAGAVYLGYRYGKNSQQQQQALSQQQRQQQQVAPATTATTSASKKQPTMVRKISSSIHDDEAVLPTTLSSKVDDENQEVVEDDDDDEESEGEAMEEGTSGMHHYDHYLSSPLPRFPDNNGTSCWSQPSNDIFFVRGANYFKDKIKIPSDKAPLECIGVDFWLTDCPERHIARHPDVLGGRLQEQDTLVVNFLLPFANFVAYFRIPPLNVFPEKLRTVWTKFLKGDQQYRDARLKLLPVVVEGPWIVKTAVGPGKSPALLGKVIPLQYYFSDPASGKDTARGTAPPQRHGTYEIDIIITASSIAKGILSVVKSQTKCVTIAFALIIEAAEPSELPENILCSFQIHSLHLEVCPPLPECNLDDLLP